MVQSRSARTPWVAAILVQLFVSGCSRAFRADAADPFAEVSRALIESAGMTGVPGFRIEDAVAVAQADGSILFTPRDVLSRIHVLNTRKPPCDPIAGADAQREYPSFLAEKIVVRPLGSGELSLNMERVIILGPDNSRSGVNESFAFRIQMPVRSD